jgi:hypothetical protein
MRVFAIALLALGSKPSRAFTTSRRHFLNQQRQYRFSSSASSLEMKKRVLVPIAEGSEEIETTCITDTLTRFGAEVTIASVMPGGELLCKMSRGIKVVADMTIEDAAKTEYDLVVCPGGMPGAKHLSESQVRE